MARRKDRADEVSYGIHPLANRDLKHAAADIELRLDLNRGSPNMISMYVIYWFLGRTLDEQTEIVKAGIAKEQAYVTPDDPKPPKKKGGDKRSFPDGLHAVIPSIPKREVNGRPKRRTLSNNPGASSESVPLSPVLDCPLD